MGTDDWTWLRGEVRAAAAAFAEQVRSAPDPAAPVPNLDWNVTELAAHLASLAELYRRQHELGPDFEPPDDWAAFSVAARSHLVGATVDDLAELLLDETETILAPAEPDERRWLYGCATTVANIAAALLVECILHGWDLARITGNRRQLTRRQALAGIEQQMSILSVFVDPAKAAPLAGTYGLRFRGGLDFTYHVDERGRLAVERGRPTTADARMNADPAAFIAVGLGRMSPILAGLTGRVVAYGRKPWRLARLGDVAVDGV